MDVLVVLPWHLTQPRPIDFSSLLCFVHLKFNFMVTASELHGWPGFYFFDVVICEITPSKSISKVPYTLKNTVSVHLIVCVNITDIK